MTYLGHHVTPRDLDTSPRPNFDINFLGQHAYLYLDMSRRDRYDSVRIIFLAFQVQKLFAKTTILPKNVYFVISWPLLLYPLKIGQF